MHQFDVKTAFLHSPIEEEVYLEATFHMEDRGRLHWFLGLRTIRDEGKVTVDHKRYI